MSLTLSINVRTATQPLRRRKILAITSELPWPLNTGGHIRTFHLMKALAREFDVRLIAGVEDAQDQGIAVLRANGIQVCPAITGQRNKLTELGRITKAAIQQQPYVMFHRHNRSALRAMIQDELKYEQPDVVYLDHVDPFAFRPLFPQAKLITDLHNIYSKLARRVAEERSWPANWYLAREAKLLAKIESQIARESSALMTVSSEEQAEFEQLGNQNVRLIPNGVDCAAYAHLPVGRQHQRPVLMYLGALSWQPNAKAAEFLAHEVIPQIRQHHPDAVLRLVGRNPGPEVSALANLPGVEVHANVPDVGVFLAEATLLTVALDSGGGTRLKILEAFAAGLPVVSTPVGCEGIDAVHGQHLWIADREQFAATVLDALAAPGLATEFAERGRHLARSRYDWTAIGQRACDAVESVLASAEVAST